MMFKRYYDTDSIWVHHACRAVGKTHRATYVKDLNRALELVTGHFDSAWMIDHLPDVLESFTRLTYLAALHPRLKFGHSVLCQSFRNPALVAKMGATHANMDFEEFAEAIDADGIFRGFSRLR